MRANTSASHAFGSTSLRRQVVMTESMMAARSAPRWEPAKVQFSTPKWHNILSARARGIVCEDKSPILRGNGQTIPIASHVIRSLDHPDDWLRRGALHRFSQLVHVIEQRPCSFPAARPTVLAALNPIDLALRSRTAASYVGRPPKGDREIDCLCVCGSPGHFSGYRPIQRICARGVRMAKRQRVNR